MHHTLITAMPTTSCTLYTHEFALLKITVRWTNPHTLGLCTVLVHFCSPPVKMHYAWPLRVRRLSHLSLCAPHLFSHCRPISFRTCRGIGGAGHSRQQCMAP